MVRRVAEDNAVHDGVLLWFSGPLPTISLLRNDEPKNGHARLHIDVNGPSVMTLTIELCCRLDLPTHTQIHTALENTLQS